MMKMMMAVMCLALVGSATATTCDATSIATCIASATSAIATSASCANYQTYYNCYSACGSSSALCTVLNTYIATSVVQTATANCTTLTNPCTGTSAVTTTVQSQKIDMTLSGYTGAMKSTYECGYWNTISTKNGVSNYCSGITTTGCTTAESNTTGTPTNVTTCTGATNTYVTGLSTVTSSYSSSRRGAGVTFGGRTLSSLITAAALSTASGFTSAQFLTALSAAYSSAGITYTAPTVGTIGSATQVPYSSAGTIAPVFGLAAAALFAVINY